jgi:ribokinase
VNTAGLWAEVYIKEIQMHPNIVVVGSINMDLVFRTPRMPAMGETISGHEFAQIAGGKGANQAVAAARQGAQTTMIACVGDDSYGQQSLSGLQADGIVTDFIHTINHIATGVAGIFVDDHGNNSIVIAPGANAQLTSAHIESARDVICKADLLICQRETPIATVREAIQLAFEHGVKVVFNPAPAMPLPDDLLAKVSYLIVNETEAGQLSGINVIDNASAKIASTNLLDRGVACVLLTMGEHGVCVTEKKGSYHAPAIKVNVVDTTAAGDTFVGAFAVGIANGLSILDATNQAQYSAALAVTKLGAQSSIPYREEVERFKKDYIGK